MSKYWMSVLHFKPKPSFVRIEHIWRHTLRYGNNAIACWTVTDYSPSMVANFTYIHDHQPDIIQVAIDGNRNKIESVTNLNQPTQKEIS